MTLATSMREASGPERSGLLPLIGIAILLSAVGAGGGVLIAQHAVRIVTASATEEAGRPAAMVAPSLSGPVRAVALPPVLTNIARPETVWVRIEASLLYDATKGEVTDALLAQVADDVRAFVATLTLAHLQGASGLGYLKQDLVERASGMSDGLIVDVAITALLIE